MGLIKQKSKKHLHIQDVPLKYFGKNKKAKDYRNELLRMMSNLYYVNQKVQTSTQICKYNISTIISKTKLGPRPPEAFRKVEEFVYHYENYCFRAYAFREKLLQFINAFFKLGFEEKDVKIKFIKINPTVKDARLVSLIEKFDKKHLGKIIEDRNSLTHKLYYGKKFDHFLRPIESKPQGAEDTKNIKKWFKEWKLEITSRSELTELFTVSVSEMNHILADRLVAYKNKKNAFTK